MGQRYKQTNKQKHNGRPAPGTSAIGGGGGGAASLGGVREAAVWVVVVVGFGGSNFETGRSSYINLKKHQLSRSKNGGGPLSVVYEKPHTVPSLRSTGAASAAAAPQHRGLQRPKDALDAARRVGGREPCTAAPQRRSPGAQLDRLPALFMHYVICPCTCAQLLKFYRAVLLIEAISAGGISTATSEGWGGCARQGSLLQLCVPFHPLVHPAPCASQPPPLLLFHPHLPLSLPVLSHYPSGETLSTHYPSQAEII